MLSLNRDLWVANPATGENGRLNATYNAGPSNLIQAVTENFGIPINHYIEIDFVSFGGLVDAFGGIDINFAHPAFDLASGLDVKQAGLVHLDGKQALAFVRSRHYAEVIDGEVVLDLTSDLGRVQRQQVFLRAIMKKAGANRNPFTLMKAADNMSNGLRIDDTMTMWEAGRFAWDMGRLDPVSIVLPVTGRTTSGGAAVLDLDQPAADLRPQPVPLARRRISGRSAAAAGDVLVVLRVGPVAAPAPAEAHERGPHHAVAVDHPRHPQRPVGPRLAARRQDRARARSRTGSGSG